MYGFQLGEEEVEEVVTMIVLVQSKKGVVMMKHPTVITQQFRSFASSIILQMPQNGADATLQMSVLETAGSSTVKSQMHTCKWPQKCMV